MQAPARGPLRPSSFLDRAHHAGFGMGIERVVARGAGSNT
jgi:hypothetical protein